MALSQALPISIPSPTKTSHFRCGSDASADLSISLPLAAAAVSPFSADQDPFAAFQLQQRLAGFSVEDILSCSTTASSRLVVLSETTTIEAAGERLAQAEDAEIWIVLKRNHGNPYASSADAHKLRTSDCAGILSLEDLSAFFAAVFGPQLTRGSAKRPSHGAHDLASPPASPSSGDSILPDARKDALVNRFEAIRTRFASKSPVDAASVANLSGMNALRHVTLQSSLQDILWHLSQDQVSCLVVSDPQRDDDGTVCGILTASDVVAFLVAEAEKDTTLASIFSNRIDMQSTSIPHQPAAVISGDKTTVDALVRMQSEQLSVLAVMEPLGGLISPISSRDISREILASSSRKILTTPLSSLVKDIRSRHPQGTDGKDVHPAISISHSSTTGRAAAVLLATGAGGVFVVDEPRSLMTPPLSSVSASPGKEFPALSLDPTSTGSTASPAQKHKRRASTQFWTASRASFGAAASDATARPAMPSLVLAGSTPDVARERKAAHRREQSFSSTASSPAPTMTAHLRTPSGQRTHRPRSLSLAQFSMEETAMSRQLGAQAAFRSQGAWTPSTLTPGSTASSAGSPSSPFGSMLVSGFFGEAMQHSMPRQVITMKTLLRSILAATTATVEEAVEA
ncbi:CBS domain protein [Kalmanozyma brasiliensis GHG001]|uniref:CBS domain protein n=1 Tax=Kalmanozyma brasiliensis (strain GHG001) TaxID=1365824 RepID=UPI002867FE37|nr:CBS domain protein [Kalmanozyma brasiliensis GHG001]KAF6767365.1 CBS domain protein [Kalmanozyma brasiliensis GHG001]